MSELLCGNCEHFYQHYTFNKRGIIRVNCGHCGVYRLRKKRPDTGACERFVPVAPGEEVFASKEYLSKELVQYLIHLDLLPEIKDET